MEKDKRREWNILCANMVFEKNSKGIKEGINEQIDKVAHAYSKLTIKDVEDTLWEIHFGKSNIEGAKQYLKSYRRKQKNRNGTR